MSRAGLMGCMHVGFSNEQTALTHSQKKPPTDPAIQFISTIRQHAPVESLIVALLFLPYCFNCKNSHCDHICVTAAFSSLEQHSGQKKVPFRQVPPYYCNGSEKIHFISEVCFFSFVLELQC